MTSCKTEDTEIPAQAARLETVMPSIAQRLFTVAHNHPLADMPIAQLRLCSLLLANENPTLSQVAEELHISASAATQLADRLEKAGMVERIAASEAGNKGDCDRRARHLRLTEKGFTLMESRRQFRQSGARRALQHLSPKDRNSLLALLEKLLIVSRLPEIKSAETADYDFDSSPQSPSNPATAVP